MRHVGAAVLLFFLIFFFQKKHIIFLKYIRIISGGMTLVLEQAI
jgi:hypothetical protein